jgi:hypothetical protein
MVPSDTGAGNVRTVGVIVKKMIVSTKGGSNGFRRDIVVDAHVLQVALRASPFVDRFWSMELLVGVIPIPL